MSSGAAFRAVALLLSFAAASAHAASIEDLVAAGRRLYERGVLPSGEAVRAERAGMAVSGAGAACVVCHRESGMGAYEGTRVVPPVAGRVLYAPVTNDADRRRPRTPEFSERYVHARPAYDLESLARALRAGTDPEGRPLDWLMPRYALDDDAVAALDAYLRTLSRDTSRAVDAQTVHFATVIAPDSSSERSETMLQVLGKCLEERMTAPGQDRRRWQLHVWHLAGPEPTWDAQLDAAQARQPVFALVSGISERGWRAMDRFCERSGVPCLFPNTDLPQAGDGASTLYLSGGLELEARVIARSLRGGPPPSRVVQVYRDGEGGADAARVLSAGLERAGIPVELRSIPAPAPLDARALATTSEATLVLWLSGKDVAALPDGGPQASRTYISGTLAGFEGAPLPRRWRERSVLVYPIDLPAARGARLAYSLDPWLQQHGITRRDERLQGNTLAACRLLVEGMARIRDVYAPQYLVESIEIAMGNAAASTPFPRFALGAGQRYGSKGSYLVKLGADGIVLPQGEWIVP